MEEQEQIPACIRALPGDVNTELIEVAPSLSFGLEWVKSSLSFGCVASLIV